ncbi:methyltransferase domain-containing protein [Actinoplanes sp. NBC_00393]|uniref:protein-L-isoaspartate O-methyltransferase family protein n=1 Tax=Actinoplanes sp. NBC_00393 TaxID=2975953 RepID=UPI002E1DD6AC
MDHARRHYLDQIRRDGVTLAPAVAKAFGAVPREVFVPDGFYTGDGRRVLPADPEFLPTVYSNDVLVTKLTGDVPVSSSSQPSLMALMIDALGVQPGMRVLEIGAGTGYNAALLATMGAVVTTVDVQPDVADRARSALARAGIGGVRVETADGYTAGPDGRYDRIIVTVGVAGVSPHWLDRLAPGGVIVVPVEHAGTHPVLAVRNGAEDEVTGAVVCPAGFMSAAGPLTAQHTGSHPQPTVFAGDLDETAEQRWDPALDALAYRDLWYAAGAWHHRVTRAGVPRREQTCFALVDDSGAAGAAVLPDGRVLASGPAAEQYTAVAVALAERWWALGRPPMRAWRVGLAPGGDPAAPIRVPRTWTLTRRPDPA